ncbi:MAG: hypothetical protein J6Y06_06755 [Bacteroidales bacterium]|nr:hypothetical protein [Bacteroidales bacterium]
MQYLRRAVKYFFWFALILCITLAVMVALGLVEANPQDMFRNGTKSLWQIAILFAVLAAIYPLTGFRKQEAIIPGELSEIKDKVIRLMGEKGYMLETENGEDMTFRLKNGFSRAMKMWEDRITMTKEPGGFILEGLRRDIVRLISFLEFKFNNNDDYSKS